MLIYGRVRTIFADLKNDLGFACGNGDASPREEKIRLVAITPKSLCDCARVWKFGNIRKLTGAKRKEWMGMGFVAMIITSDYGSFPHSLRLAPARFSPLKCNFFYADLHLRLVFFHHFSDLRDLGPSSHNHPR